MLRPSGSVAPSADLLPEPAHHLAHQPTEPDDVAAVRLGVWVSATRCLLTYVLAPAIGLAAILAPVGLALQVLGCITSTAAARRLWRSRHRWRMAYCLVAGAVLASTTLTLAQTATQLTGAIR